MSSTPKVAPTGMAAFDPAEKRRENTCANQKVALPVDRKSTRLNSSHRCISYALFCLKHTKAIHNSLSCFFRFLSPIPIQQLFVHFSPHLFFFNDTAPPEIYPLPLPDPLPIQSHARNPGTAGHFGPPPYRGKIPRGDEH